jgi:hypothetical protein
MFVGDVDTDDAAYFGVVWVASCAVGLYVKHSSVSATCGA